MSHLYKDFYELDIWKDGYSLLMKVYYETDSFPSEEKYSLTSQLRRSGNSVIANMSEAHGRYYFKDKNRTLYIARAEIVETRSHLAVAFGRRYIKREKFVELNDSYCKLAKDLNLYINSLKK
ncbi:four helix bundle protein [Candidatus Parcubacteria bacterium]|jgi:four helix bundle protein|nr:four helix bundle protein [Candidatus Parcubacteria bacterium]MBT3949122.1 four helix bundle protein [Candidatus Parcubacteria bacterium]